MNWNELSRARTLEQYRVEIDTIEVPRGTKVAISQLTPRWSEGHTEFLATHAEFLASVPGQEFRIALKVDGKQHPLDEAAREIDRFAEAELEMKVGSKGVPRITRCLVKGDDEKNIVFRPMKAQELDPRLEGVRLELKFFRRDEAKRTLGKALARNELVQVLERYQGIRIFRDGINVPPYGINRDDWAGLEKQRTATGGPTLVPGIRSSSANYTCRGPSSRISSLPLGGPDFPRQ